MELRIRGWQNNRKNWTNFSIKSEDFNYQYVVEKLIKNLSLEQNKIKIRGLSIDSKKFKRFYLFCN